MDKNNGFTLIELLVIVGVTALILSLTLSYYNNFDSQQQLRTEARKVVDVLELAKNKAAAGDSANFCINSFSGYEVNFTNSSYTLHPCCGMDCTKNTIVTYSIPSNTSISILNTGCIKFLPLTAGIDTSATTACYPYTLQLKSSILPGGPGGKNCLTIQVDNSGVIKLNDSSFGGC